MSWDEAFASRYDEWAAPMTADVGFYVELARTVDGPIVELAVGNGRVAIPVAQAVGRRVIGIDLSPAMLEQARTRAAAAGVDLDLRHGDTRELSLDEPAALVYCPFRSLLHVPTWADRRRTFERVAASLLPGGLFAWNAFAFDHAIASRLDGAHQDTPVPHTLNYAVGDNRVDIILDGGETSSLWWATKNEWLGLIDVTRCGRAIPARLSTSTAASRRPLPCRRSTSSEHRYYRPPVMSDDAGRDDPVSWLMIRPGWKVVAADGVEVGEVDEIAGDDTQDVFDGLAVATSAFGKPRYVLSEQVGLITQGVVHLTIDRTQAEQLGEYLEPATSAEIQADSKGGPGETIGADIREIEAKEFAPIQRHEHSMNIWRRIAFFFRRKRG